MEACGTTLVSESHTRRSLFLAEILVHIRGLFATRKMILSTLLLWLSWALIGIAYPLFQVFLPTYLASRGAQFGQLSTDVTWRNYAIANVCSIFGPVAGGLLAKTVLGRKYTMVVGALLTSTSIPHTAPFLPGTDFIVSFFWAYSRVTNNASNVAFTCVVNFTL